MKTSGSPSKFVVDRARQLNVDPLFIHRVCVAATIYYESRSTEIKLPPTKKETRKPHQDMIAAARDYLHAAGALGINPESADIQAVKARIEICDESLGDIDRLKMSFGRNWALLSLCSRLVQIFESFEVSDRRLPRFISDIIDHISPPDDESPGFESIRKVVKEAKK